MDLKQLRYLLALNEHRSFVRGADAMNITQPAFSRSIQNLEQELGCQLVDRRQKELPPTPEGQVVLQHARLLVQGARNLVNEVTQLKRLDAGELHFGCGPAPLQSLVPDAVAAFSTAHPGILVRLQVDNWERLGRSLIREELEFAVADSRHFSNDPTFNIQPLKRRDGVFFCRAGHPLLSKESLSTNDLFAYPLATPLLPPATRKQLASLSGLVDFSSTVQCEDQAALVRIVRQTDMLGIAGEEGIREHLQQGLLQALTFRNMPSNLETRGAHCAIISRNGYRLAPAAQEMITTLLRIDQTGTSPLIG
ncbi:LysR family transcriptional regulator [Pseudomonas sp. ABC1]|uniref:LysR family transcriptional regulator n=1 Tax=Pseudomonas sp. ABC1 TaxID=2748080 RepID=UPI0015C3641F|nr:LysR family transcriptional regulator [Pseudomonas sp. ABC1]QLF94340.1 LysR family transcriptional regulator [Pseudomonas sp. ABC1]